MIPAGATGTTPERSPVDFAIAPKDDLLELFAVERARLELASAKPLNCLLVDKAQFLTESKVDDLMRIAILADVPVLAYGIRTDFQTVALPGSRRLVKIAHSLEELNTICRCGRKALFNTRTVGGHYTFDGDQVAIEDGVDVDYESLGGARHLEAAYYSGPGVNFASVTRRAACLGFEV